ncbi:MAG: fatty acyl-AMP ligase [Candidatus Sericytochromatia bacterium]
MTTNALSPSAPLDVTAVRRTALPWASHVDVLRHRALHQPQKLAIGWVPQLGEVVRQLSYAELDRRAQAVAARLQALGAKGERALLMHENDPDYAVAFYACGHAGAVAVTLNTPTQKKHLARLAHVASDAGARFILTTRALADRFRARIDEVEALAGLTWVIVDEVSDAEADSYAPHQPEGDDVAFLQYTSGSTGTPRGVVVRHADLVYQGEYIAGLLSLTSADRALSWLPLFHDMGLILGLLQPIYSGFPLYLSNPVAFVKNPAQWLRTIAQHGITLSGGPDFAYDLCCEVVDPADLEGLDLSRWQIAFNGAEPVRARTLDRFTETFAPLGFRPEAMTPCYGLAEATLGVTANLRGTRHLRRLVDGPALSRGRVQAPENTALARDLVASGRWLPDTTIRIVDPVSCQAHGAATIGEIWIGGTGPAQGYWKQPEATADTFDARIEGEETPYLRTGDLGFYDAEGRLFITGRVKDLIVVHGKNHFPSDIEQTVEAASAALRPHFAAAFAVDHGDRESLVVVAEVKASALETLDVEAVGRDVMRRVLAEHEIPVDEVVLLHQGQIPKTTSGKVQRAECRQAWLDGTFSVHGVARRGVQA